MSTVTANGYFNKPAVNSAVDADTWGTTTNVNWDVLDAALNLRTADYNFADFDLIAPNLKDSSEQAYALGNISGAVTIDYVNGHWQYGTVIGNITSLTINNPPATGTGGFLTLELIQDATGARTIALTSAYKTSQDTALTLSAAANSVDELYLRTRDGGTTWRLSYAKDFR